MNSWMRLKEQTGNIEIRTWDTLHGRMKEWEM